MRVWGFAAIAALMLAAACVPGATKDAAQTQAAACPDDGPRLPGTGICVGRAVNYLNPEDLVAEYELPEGCVWTVNEALIAGGMDEALLYRAMSCKGVTTTLQVNVGAQTAEVVRTASALGATDPDQVLIRMFTSDPADPQFHLRDMIERPEDPKEMAGCVVQPAAVEGWPKDALVIGLAPEARAKLPADDILAVCGRYGRDEGSVRYWRVRQGYAFFFDLGQDQFDFDPATVTVIRKGPDGAWGAAE